jgi:hypothetical protein
LTGWPSECAPTSLRVNYARTVGTAHGAITQCIGNQAQESNTAEGSRQEENHCSSARCGV